MKFVVSGASLSSHLQAISRVLNSKNTLAILDCFLLEVKGNSLRLTAADTDSQLKTSIEIMDVEGEGALAINAKTLLDALRELPNQPLTFEIDNETLEVNIYFLNGKYNFVGAKANDFPMPKELKESAISLNVSAQILCNGITCSLFATADDELRPVMNGVYFDITTESLTLAASDGHKLIRIINTNTHGESKASFILPKKPANLLKQLLARDLDNVKIDFDENNAVFTMSNFTMICRFIEGRYPNYNSVIPTNNTNLVKIDRVDFLNALKRVSVFANPASSLVKLEISEDKMVVSAQDIDFLTSAQETLSCEYSGTAMSMGFKAAFLIEVLNNIPSTEAILKLQDPSRPGLVVPAENEAGEDMLMMLMPMMLNY